MSFRDRLRLFFALVVIVPMVALGVLLFALAGRSETGKADAGIATGVRTALGAYQEEVSRAQERLEALADDPALRGASSDRRLGQLVRGDVVAVELWSADGARIARAGSSTAVAAAGQRLEAGGTGDTALLVVSVTEASAMANRIASLTGLQAAVARGGAPLASTVPNGAPVDPPGSHSAVTFDVAGTEYRGKFTRVDGPAGPPVELGVLTPTASLAQRIEDARLLIAAVFALFVLVALAGATLVSRSLAGQIGTFLEAARRLSRGDFRSLVPVHGNDEFAELGSEFNDMSLRLDRKIAELELKRQELAETIRRVGDALATGLDRDGVVALAVRQAVDACGADGGRALPLARGAFERSEVGAVGGELRRVIEAAERDVFAVSAEVGPELIGALEGAEDAERTRRAVSATGAGVHALSIGMRSLVDGPEYLGAISIARRGHAFTREEEELLEYLAGQAVVSIENAGLHEAVERQAVTDELTGLSNVRALMEALDRELERSRRFDTPLALVMVDIDDFKAVNDRYGHQQGDEVLAQIARVLRDESRELDMPARYGGEELAVVVPQTDAGGAALLAERMREAIEALRVPKVRGRGALSVTASFGVAAVPEHALERGELVAAADAALYRAKRAGKNRVERASTAVAEPSAPPR